VERLLDLSGGHPYLLKRLLEDPKPDCDGFFADLWKAADSVPERAVLKRLMAAGKWVSLEELRDISSGQSTKATLDRLANTGLIQRTLVDGGAAARIISPWLTEWARRSGVASAAR
jgi:hypothetical protein